jgi:hypothetical protein
MVGVTIGAMAIRGKCLCEGVRFEIDGPLGPLGYCHCGQCRRASGSAFGANADVAKSDLRFVSGAELVREFESSPGTFRAFCGRCGSPVYKRSVTRPEVMRIRLGTLEDDPKLRARAHVFVAEKAPWYEITDSLPQFQQGLPKR